MRWLSPPWGHKQSLSPLFHPSYLHIPCFSGPAALTGSKWQSRYEPSFYRSRDTQRVYFCPRKHHRFPHFCSCPSLSESSNIQQDYVERRGTAVSFLHLLSAPASGCWQQLLLKGSQLASDAISTACFLQAVVVSSLPPAVPSTYHNSSHVTAAFLYLRYSLGQVEQNPHRKILQLLFFLALTAHLPQGGCCGNRECRTDVIGENVDVSAPLSLVQPPLHRENWFVFDSAEVAKQNSKSVWDGRWKREKWPHLLTPEETGLH